MLSATSANEKEEQLSSCPSSINTQYPEAPQRPISPFPTIPDVNIESDVISEDIERFQNKESIKSHLRPESPFPSIPDITLTPEIVEKDITQMRLSPVPFTSLKLETTANNDEVKPDALTAENVIDENHNPNTEITTPIKSENNLSDVSTDTLMPFPDIPCITESNIFSSSSLIQPPLRKYEPVSLTGKKYAINEPKVGTFIERPQYNFALADTEHKVIERAYSEGTANAIRSLQSEIFESQGHFNASRSCSPFPVYIPLSREPTPMPRELYDAQNQNIIKNDPPTSTDRDDTINMPHIESNVEKRLRDSTITGNETVSNNLKSQQKCFSELRDIQFCYAVANGETLSLNEKNVTENVELEENEVQKRLKEMKFIREGKYSDTTTPNFISSVCNLESKTVNNVGESNNITSSVEKIKSTPAKETDLKEFPEKINDSAKKQRTCYETTDVPELLCKKPPNAIIGARPLFGQLDITSEFKKAIVGRSKSLQSKQRSKTESKQIENTSTESKVKAEKYENIETEDITSDSKLSTQMKDTTRAEVTTLQANANEEIEKIYFQQEREYEVDIQTRENNFDFSSVLQNIGKPVKDKVEYFGPNTYAVANTHDTASKTFNSCNNTNGISRSSRVNSNLNVCKKSACFTLQEHENHKDDDEYKKVPVKSLIQNFEQCSMPAMRYKQIRDPLPDVVDKLSNARGEVKDLRHDPLERQQNQISYTFHNQISINNPSQEFNLKRAEEEFENLFYVANASVRTQPYFPKLEMQNFQQSENSSFCRYSSHSNLSQSIPCNPSPIASSANAQKCTDDVTQEGKLYCFILFFNSDTHVFT